VAAKAAAVDSSGETERALCAAIAGHYLVRFVLSGCERIAEPHDFAGSRPTPSGRHRRWDRIIAIVSRPAST